MTTSPQRTFAAVALQERAVVAMRGPLLLSSAAAIREAGYFTTRCGDALAREAAGSEAMPRRNSDMPLEPTRLVGGQYRVLESIGESCYGQAFRAEHAALGHQVTLHKVSTGNSSNERLARDLPLIIAKCALVVHANVVTVRCSGSAEGDTGELYIVTDSFEGISLADYLHAEGALPVDLALTLVRQMGRALRAAHNCDNVHGDLQPACVRTSMSAKGPQLRVTGFGALALSQRDDPPMSGVRKVSLPSYMAPERFDGATLDPRTDVYALGAILFRMIAGVPPFTGATSAAVMQAHRHAPVPSLRAYAGPHVSHELDALVARSLAKQKDERFPDLVTMMRALRGLMPLESAHPGEDDGERPSLPSIAPSAFVEADVTHAPSNVTAARAVFTIARTWVRAFASRFGAWVSGRGHELCVDTTAQKAGKTLLATPSIGRSGARLVLQELLVEDFTSEEDRWTAG